MRLRWPIAVETDCRNGYVLQKLYWCVFSIDNLHGIECEVFRWQGSSRGYEKLDRRNNSAHVYENVALLKPRASPPSPQQWTYRYFWRRIAVFIAKWRDTYDHSTSLTSVFRLCKWMSGLDYITVALFMQWRFYVSSDDKSKLCLLFLTVVIYAYIMCWMPADKKALFYDTCPCYFWMYQHC